MKNLFICNHAKVCMGSSAKNCHHKTPHEKNLNWTCTSSRCNVIGEDVECIPVSSSTNSPEEEMHMKLTILDKQLIDLAHSCDVLDKNKQAIVDRMDGLRSNKNTILRALDSYNEYKKITVE